MRIVIGILIVLIVALLLGLLFPREVSIKPTPKEISEANDLLKKNTNPLEVITKIAHAEQISPVVLIKLARCESSMRHDGVYGDHGLAYGLMQFHEETFDEFKARAGMPELQYRNMADQVKLTAWALKSGLGYHWSCYRENP